MNENQQYVSPYKIHNKYDITSNTLRNWAISGKIRFIRSNNGVGKRLYNLQDIIKYIGVEEFKENKKTKTICYARVSSSHQKEDLNRQIEVLKQRYPDAELIHEIGSGLNFKRKGFETLLEQIYSGSISEIVVTYKDRLCRFGFELFEWILKKHNVKLVVLNTSTGSEGTTQELAEDLLSVTNYFVAKNNGLRAANYRKNRIDQGKEGKDGKDGKDGKEGKNN
jgi:putative resolvase